MRVDPALLGTVRPMSPRQARIGGAVIIVLSIVIAAIAAGMMFMLLETPIPAGWLPAGIRIDGPRTGPHWDRVVSGLGGLLATILLFAVAGLVQGTVMLVLGRRNLVLLRVMLVIVGVLLAVGAVAALVLGRRIGQTGQ